MSITLSRFLENSRNLVEVRGCPKCKTVKPLTDFTIRQSGPRKGDSVAHCKTCNTEALQERKARDPSIYRRVEWPSKLKRLYGITQNDYYRMLEAQGGCCAICGSRNPKARKYRKAAEVVFCVDHCHATGRVRGLLCTACNRAVGLIEDNRETALKMAEYLKQKE
jgi:hypothetical protein